MVTGSDILNYRGDAGLGLGGGSGVQYVGNPANTNPLAGIDSTVDLLERHALDAQNKLWQQKIADRDATAKWLVGLQNSGQSAFNMKDAQGNNMSITPLQADKQEMDAKANEINEYMMQHPNAGQWDVNLRKLVQEHNDLVNHAGFRATQMMKARLEASANPDPAEQQAILDNADKEIAQRKLSEFYTPMPYMNKAPIESGFDESVFDLKKHPENAQEKLVQTKDAQGNQILQTHGFFNPSVVDQRTDIMADPKRAAKAERYAALYSHILENSPQAVIAQNRDIDRAQAQLRARGDNTTVIPKIYDVVQAPNGQLQVVNLKPDATAADKVWYLKAPKYLSSSISEKAGKTALDVQGEKADIAKKQADVAHMYASIKDMKQKAEQAKIDNNEDEWAANTAAAEVAQTLLPLKTADWNKASWVKDAPELTVKKGKEGGWFGIGAEPEQKAKLDELVKNSTGHNFDSYLFVPLPQSKSTTDMGGKRLLDDKGKISNTTEQPEKAFYLHQPGTEHRKDILLFGYLTNPDDTKNPKQYDWRIVTQHEAVHNYTNALNNFASDKEKTPLKAIKAYKQTHDVLTPDEFKNYLNEKTSDGRPVLIKKETPRGTYYAYITDDGSTEFYNPEGKLVSKVLK